MAEMKLPPIGEFMKKGRGGGYFTKHGGLPPSSTLIRPGSLGCNAADSLYCMQLGQNTVHGAMAGF
jgi:6-phosphofructokinase 1